MGKTVVLMSGGMDSFIGAMWAREHYDEVEWHFFHLSHRYALKELAALQNMGAILQQEDFAMPLFIVHEELSLGTWEKEDAEIPARNMYLIMLACMDENVTNVVLTVQKGEQSIPDRSPAFISNAERLLEIMYHRNISIKVPFDASLTKGQMTKWYIDKEYSLKALSKTVGCYSGTDENHCSECAACFRRFIAFEFAGIGHLSGINTAHMMTWPEVDVYVKKMKEGQYDRERVEETMAVLRRYNRW